MAGLGASLAMAFWVGIGSIVTKNSSPRPVSHSCTATLLSRNATAVIHSTLSSAVSVTLDRQSGLRRFYSLSYMWYSALNCFTVILVGLVVSFLTGPMKEEDVTPGTVYPLLRNVLFFLHKPNRPKQRVPAHPPHKEINGLVNSLDLEDGHGTLQEERTGFLLTSGRA